MPGPILSQQSFELHRALVITKHITAPSLFKKGNWKSMDNPTLRSEIVAEHEKHLAKFEWNASEQLKVSLMVQGTTTEAGWSIAQGGYGVIASVNDQGWFGKGIYMSSSMRYAHQYAERTASMAKKAPALLVCAVGPSNSFPIIHRMDGRSVEDGYQSHYTVGEHSLSLSFDILLGIGVLIPSFSRKI